MAVVLYKGPNKTVADIAARNLITKKVDHMVVTVLDASSDSNVGSAVVATYRWNASLNDWILISKASTDTVSFATEELTIASGAVAPSNIPLDNVIWGIVVVNGNVIEAEPRLEDLTVSPTSISGLGAWDGLKLRFTYAYGSIASQISSVLDVKYDKTGGEISGHVLPSVDVTYDLGSLTNRWRDLYLSGTTINLGGLTLSNNAGKLEVNNGGGAVESLTVNSVLSDLSDVSATAPNSGEVLSWNGSAWAPTAAAGGGATAINDLTDVNITSPGQWQVMLYNGSTWSNYNFLRLPSGGIYTFADKINAGMRYSSGDDEIEIHSTSYITPVMALKISANGMRITSDVTAPKKLGWQYSSMSATAPCIVFDNIGGPGSYAIAQTGFFGASDFVGVTIAGVEVARFNDGGLNMSSNIISNVGAPSVGTDAANKTYVDGVSDARLKIQLDREVKGKETILSLKPTWFDWKEGEFHQSGNELGFIAQDVEVSFPEAVRHDSEYLTLKDRSIIAALVKHNQELEARLAALESKLNS